jgi:hypothetical protein
MVLLLRCREFLILMTRCCIARRSVERFKGIAGLPRLPASGFALPQEFPECSEILVFP